MGVIDASTWQALGITLSMLGLVVSFVLWRVRGPAAGIRGVAWSLLPAAAGLTGTLKLAWEIADSVVNWAVRLVFSPVVWLGIILAGVSVVLFGVSAAMRSRGVGGAAGARGAKMVGGKRSAGDDKALPAERGSRTAQPAVKDDDMDDIEAILKKHGIS